MTLFWEFVEVWLVLVLVLALVLGFSVGVVVSR